MNNNKTIWTEADYEQMNWHDCRIYGFIFEQREDEEDDFYRITDLVFDIDYITKWTCAPNEHSFSFEVAPCTLVFENVWDFQMNIDTKTPQYQTHDIEINSIVLTNKELINGYCIYTWLIDLHVGKIEFSSHGYKQIMRQKPLKDVGQHLTLKERKGISFSKSCRK